MKIAYGLCQTVIKYLISSKGLRRHKPIRFVRKKNGFVLNGLSNNIL